MKVFLSWSKNPSGEYAKAFKDWLEIVLQNVKPFLSHNIEPGSRPVNAIFEDLKDSDYGIFFVTPNNHDKQWLNFEAGAIYKGNDQNNVTTLVFDDAFDKIVGPLKEFQAKMFNKENVWEILESLRKKSNSNLSENKMKEIFKKNWPDLESRITEIEEQKNWYSDEELSDPPIQPQISEILGILNNHIVKPLPGIKNMEWVEKVINRFEQFYIDNNLNIENITWITKNQENQKKVVDLINKDLIDKGDLQYRKIEAYAVFHMFLMFFQNKKTMENHEDIEELLR